jgi:serine kinase of HPr protein (carbohydrate metabolism regulator)
MYLDSIVNLILWQTHLTRIHAGCVARNGHGVLLCGDSGAGKSCLTYACARRGWTFISDEAPSILRRSEERIVIGKPQLIHFRETAFELFPELAGREARPNLVGKISFEVRTAELAEIRTAYRTRIAAIVFLNRQHEGPAALVPMAKEEVWRRLAADLPFFEEPAHEEHKASLRNLLGAETYELRYSDFDSAIQLLETLTGEGGGQ